MSRALVKFDLDGYHMSDNFGSPNPDDRRTIRLERRWRRREAAKSSLNRVASATRKTAKIYGNKAVENDHIIDESRRERIVSACTVVDEEVGLGPVNGSSLQIYNLDSETDTASNHRSSSNIDADFSNNNDSDAVDEDYGSYLRTHYPDIETDCASDHIGGSNMDSEEVDADYASFLASNINVHVGNNNDDDEVDTDYGSSLARCHPDIETDCASNHRQGKKDAYYGSFFPTNVRQNSLLSDQEFHTPELQGDVDEDYALFLKFGCIDDGDMVYPCDKNTTNTPNMEDETNSSDSDVVVLDPESICEDTFVRSKTYVPSCFVEETNPIDNKKIVCYGQSQFRKRLVQQLDRPYDQEEYDSLELRVRKEMPKKRHFETRQRVIENYSSDVTESYLEIYPDLHKAIDKEARKKPRILFLLRGFFFWIENCCHPGSFQPWQDESCLEIMRKM